MNVLCNQELAKCQILQNMSCLGIGSGDKRKMVVNVEYITSVREVTKKQAEKIELEDYSTARDLIEKLIANYGPKFKETIFPAGGNKVGVYIAILAKEGFLALDGLDANLNDGDTVLIGTLLMGG